MSLSSRSKSIDPSGIRKAFAMAAQLKNPCDLSIGKPHFDLHQQIKDAAKTAIDKGQNGYTQSQGIEPLKNAILEKFQQKGIPQEDALITSGVSGGLVLALLALTDPGDEVIISDPYFLMYKQLPSLFGVKTAIADTYPHFRWTEEILEKCVTPKTKAIFVGSPANPTGLCISKEEALLLAAFAKKYDLWIVYDEIYEAFCFDQPPIQMSEYYPKTLTLGGFSKSHNMTGWRVGTACGPAQLINEMTKLQQISFVCAPSVGQWAALEASYVDPEPYAKDYKEKRDFIFDSLKDHYQLIKPNGAFYAFIQAPEGMTGEEFVFQAMEKELILVPGSTFSEKNTHFRLSFATSWDVLKRASLLLQELALSIKKA